MAISVEVKNGQLHIRDGEKLYRLNPESIGAQIKLTAQNGVEQADVQAELEAVHAKIDGMLAASEAMIFKGVVSADGDLPTTYEPGWTWKVGTAGTYKGRECEIGDLIIAIASRAGSGNEDNDFSVVQTNIDGAVTGPASAVDGNIVSFDQTTGKIIKDSGLKTTDVQAAVAFSGKVASVTAAAVPEQMPENLLPGGLLVVGPDFGG